MKTVLLLFLVSACSMLPFPGSGGGKQTSTSSSSKTDEMTVNGRPVALDDEEEDKRGRSRGHDDDDDDDRPKRKSKKSKKVGFGKMCARNHECIEDTCFVGRGELGYCTKMCDSWTDCPDSWECEKPGNTAQRICVQGL